MAYRTPLLDKVEESTYDINLAPMLDMLVVLITVMLVSFTSIKLGLLDGLVPQPVARAMDADKNNKARDLDLQLKAGTKSIILEVKEKGSSLRKIHIGLKEGKYDLVRLHSELVELKQKYPKVFRLEFSPSESLTYSDIILIMDRVRTTTSGDPKIVIKDEKTNEVAETNLLFPDIVFANAIEG